MINYIQFLLSCHSSTISNQINKKQWIQCRDEGFKSETAKKSTSVRSLPLKKRYLLKPSLDSRPNQPDGHSSKTSFNFFPS